MGWKGGKSPHLFGTYYIMIEVLIFIITIPLYYDPLIIKHQTFESSPNICLHCCVSTTYEENQEGSTPNSGLPNILRAFHGCFFQLEKVNAMAELATWVAMTNFIFMIYFFPWNDSQEVLTKTLVVFSGSIWEGEWYSNKAKCNGSVPDFASKPMLWLVRISED